ncbi:high mobility group protein B4-like [Cimex lectularius]|uniref:HMG box domain-containing protein n=1 Tax=Cimex lectularius TaxID=79782 RepID=A0A8I6SPL2_CIMLE|nr:high mobility group protein B4-like [Cimex lectularius]XP_014261452.1 high mobility group protein B4-like [Cimex lectularius]
MSKRNTESYRPKRPISAYIYFVKEEFRKQKGVDVATMGRRCAEKWSSMNESEKQKYVDKASADLRRYNLEKKHIAPKKKQGRKNAYLIFYLSQFSKVKSENPTFKLTEIAKEVSKMWKALEPTEKERYKRMAELENSKNQKKAPTMKVNQAKNKQRHHHQLSLNSATFPLEDMNETYEDVDLMDELDEMI